jgi:exodeoxyribonuclease VII large subunit
LTQNYVYLDTETTPPQGPLSVSAALDRAKHALEGITLSIIGELSDISDNPRYKAVYFTLADKGAALPCLMWRSAFDRLGIVLKSGMEVEVRGRFSLYSAKGRMQFEVRQLSVAGEGQLRAQVAALAARLRSQGLMEPARKLPLPALPETIALITSPQGKAVHDVLRTLRRRFPLARVLFFGVKVEGRDAPEHIIQALRAAEASEAAVILLVRGGGSYEDLMPFNDEALALALAASQKPVITGIGHEPDTSIADMVASLRASTPTAAAEAAAPDQQELEAALRAKQDAFALAMARQLERSAHALEGLQRSAVFMQDRFLTAERALNLEQTALRLDVALPTGLAAARQSLEASEQRLGVSAAVLVSRQAYVLQHLTQSLRSVGTTATASSYTTLAAAAASLEGLSPLAVLSRGYALGYDEQDRIVRSVDQVEPGHCLRVRLSDGSIRASVVSTEKQEKP